MVNVRESKAPFNAQVHSVGGCMRVGGDFHNLVIDDIEVKLATNTTVSAGCSHFLFGRLNTDGRFERQGSGGAVSNAGSTGFTTRVNHIFFHARGNVGFKTSFRYTPDKPALNFGAGSDTAGAQNAFVQVYKNEGIRIRVNLIACLGSHIFMGIKTIEASPFVEFVIRVIGFVTLIVINTQQKLKHRAP